MKAVAAEEKPLKKLDAAKEEAETDTEVAFDKLHQKLAC